MNFPFHPEAYDEFLRAASWYEDQETGLGDDFASEINRAIATIVSDPLRFRVVEGPDRICRVQRFPYSIFYRYDPLTASVLISTVFHQSRRPGTWKTRYFDSNDLI
jgi:plasmid stabilization system protein ParE